MFRRMIFNYLTDNKDDHCKNFSFMVIDDNKGHHTWRLAPAYDLTLCTEGYNGEHATSINGTGNPSLDDMITVGTRVKMDKQQCQAIYNEVKAACNAGGLLIHEIKE
jgi:serine/threonine-protein kinase HipA